jgi:hypothetical protein
MRSITSWPRSSAAAWLRPSFELLVRQPGGYFLDPLDVDDVTTLGVSAEYILSEDDRVLARPGAEFASRIGLTSVLVPGGHESMLTRPDEVAEALLTSTPRPLVTRLPAVSRSGIVRRRDCGRVAHGRPGETWITFIWLAQPISALAVFIGRRQKLGRLFRKGFSTMAIRLRRFRVLGIVGFAALTVTLVSACNGNGNFNFTDNSTGNSPAPTSTVATSTQGSDSGAGSGHAGVSTAPVAAGVPTAAAGAPTPPAASARRCEPTDLSFTLAANRDAAQNQRTQVVDMTNRASSTCTMAGFPGVDLIGDTKSQPSYDWTLTRASATSIPTVTLRPGAIAHFDLVYVSGDLASGGGSENVISVQKMVITTPGDNDQSDNAVQGSLAWFQDVVLQDGATHPGTYITQVASGS